MNAHTSVTIMNCVRTVCVSAVTVFMCYHFKSWWFVLILLGIAPLFEVKRVKEDGESE